MRNTIAAACLAPLLVACSSSEPEPAAEPARTTAAQPAQPAQAQPAKRIAVSGTRPEAPAARPRSGAIPAGHVMFTVERRPLDEVLGLFEQQAGIKIAWKGEPRPVSLRLKQPMQWNHALELVCQFTRTHLARDYQSRWVLKDGYGGTLGDDADVAALLKEQKQGGGGISSEGGYVAPRASGGSSGGYGAAASNGGGGTRYNETGSGGLGKSEFGDAYGGGDTARRLLGGVSQTSSGPR